MVRPRISHLLACAALAATCFAAVPGPVQAQGLFDLLGRIFRGNAPRAYQPEPPRLLEGFPGEGYEKIPSSGPDGPYVSYCVRLCDGRYFPIPRNAGAPSMNDRQMCRAMCPAAKTNVFAGTQIDRAVARDGKSYSSIENAFAYRERLVQDCTCNGRDTAGVATIDPEQDPTLRPGDIVVTGDGPRVFQGNRKTPHRTSDFVPAKDARGLPKSMQQMLSDMRIAPERLAATAKTGEPAPSRTLGAPAKPALTMMPDDGPAQQGDPKQN